MTGGSAEVSKKIRAAIKAKLEELGVYVDEELPDYIMVMIANKKEKTQMKEDLLLFLGKNSEKFVDWLFDIFERLQSATIPNAVQESNDIKRRDNESSGHRKELENSSKREKEKTIDKKKKQESSSSRTVLKEHDRKEKERQRGMKESERRESEKRTGIAKVVKSKPSRRTKSPVLPPEKMHRRKKPESPEHRATVRFGVRRNDGDRYDRKFSQVRSDGRAEKEAKEDAKYSKRRNDEEDKRAKKDICASKISGDSGQDILQRKRKAQSRSPSLEENVDEEERIAAEESARILRSKKVQSSAVVKLPPEPTVKSVSSQVIVKRKLPEKEVTTKQSRGVKSLFLKAIKEAGETTRTASQIAGYGSGLTMKKEKEIADHGKHKQNDMNVLDEEEGIEIDVYDDIGDALVVMPDESSGGNNNGRSIVQKVDECSLSEPEVERKRMRTYGPNSVEEPKFYITLKGNSISGLAKRLTKIGEGNVEFVSKKKAKRRKNETNPILAHLNLSQPRQIRREVSHEKSVANSMENEACLIARSNEVPNDSKPLPAWDLQIQLPEEDTSDDGDDDDDGDDEARIDAVLASAQTVGQGFDEVPPTPALSSPLFRPQTPPPQLFYSASRQNISNASIVSSAGAEKIMERCKFWPNCSLQNCVYIHPSKPCSNFPNCSFGDRCIYIHPQCKFGRMCLNPNCVYAHILKATTAITVAPSPEMGAQASLNSVTPAASYALNIPCKYGGKCANASCSFKHPKLCRFGDRCTNRACYFWHPKASAVALLTAASGKYRWKAPSVAAT
uniref:Zinc finger CCCH domain-containing protein 14 n=1 Tax=Loa loa TaxID=7209 RepID=A0A1I7VXQ2_LOALO